MPEQTEKKLTGYPSIDKPWLKYYSEDAINAPLPNTTLFHYAYKQNADHLDGIAFRYFGKRVKYSTFFEKAKLCGKAFHSLGVCKGDIVTIMSMHTPEVLYALFGLNFIGAVANMVYMTLSAKEIAETVQKTNSKALVVLDLALERVLSEKNITVPVIVLSAADSMPALTRIGYRAKNRVPKHDYWSWDRFMARAVKADFVQAAKDPGALAVIVYTSGTTGEPKGVMLSNDNITALVSQYLSSGFNFKRDDTFMSIIPLFLGYGIGMQSIAICAGLNSELWIQPEAYAVAKEYARTRPKHIEIGLTMLDAFLETPIKDLSHIVNFCTGGGALLPEKERAINQYLKTHNAKIKIIMGYGMTELASGVCNNLHHATKESSVGVPLPKANVKIVDPDGKMELHYGEIGEICFNAPNLMMGYFANAAATSDTIELAPDGTRWIHTGDLGYVGEDGFVFIKGRLKRIFTSLGPDNHVYRLFPQRIEEFLESQSPVESCGVIVLEDKKRLHVSVAFVKIHENCQYDDTFPEKLTDKLKKELPEHLQPVAVHLVDTMPMTPSGKINYQALEKMAKSL